MATDTQALSQEQRYERLTALIRLWDETDADKADRFLSEEFGDSDDSIDKKYSFLAAAFPKIRIVARELGDEATDSLTNRLSDYWSFLLAALRNAV